MWCYNILGDIEGSISDTLWLDTINAGSVLLNANLVVLKRGNSEPNLIAKIIEWG